MQTIKSWDNIQMNASFDETDMTLASQEKQ